MYRMVPQRFVLEQIEDIKKKKREELEAKYGSTPWDILLQAKKLYAVGESVNDQTVMSKMADLGKRLREKFPTQLG